jgi:hypothetical protein
MAAFGSDGISLGIGAGVGMGLATIGAFRHQGHTRTLYPGEVGMVTLLEGLRIPQQALERAQLERSRTIKELLGFDVKVISAQVRDDERLDKRLIMTLQIVNDSNRPVYPCDIMLMPRGGGKTVVADVVSSGLSLYSALPPSDDPQVLTMSFPLEPGSDPRDYDITLVDPISKDLLAKQHVAKAH